MRTVETINAIIMALFFLCYSYQFVYLAIGLFTKPKKTEAADPRRQIAVLIAARNEEAVIGQLLDSVRAQNYPPELLDAYVVADNCTDATAVIARAHGAEVFARQDTRHVGKGYALQFLLDRIRERRHYDAYLVLDADNILDPNFVREITAVHDQGYGVVTCYRNSKNYGDNWISAGYALWFLREARYLNGARMAAAAARRQASASRSLTSGGR